MQNSGETHLHLIEPVIDSMHTSSCRRPRYGSESDKEIEKWKKKIVLAILCAKAR